MSYIWGIRYVKFIEMAENFKNLSKTVHVRIQLGDLEVDGKIILKHIFGEK
jgi:hypothetical protein